jgi:hypothetical protein
VACLTSADPEFSFNQYIRNRDAAGWSYRLGAAGEARQEDQPAPIDA